MASSDHTMDHMEGAGNITTANTTTTTVATTTPSYKKSNLKAQVPPFPTLVGEYPLLLSKTVDGNAMITNFRLCVCERRSFINLPLMMIAEATIMETPRRLKLSCKDGSTYVCTFATSEDTRQIMEVLRDKIGIPANLQDIFAFKFHKEAVDKAKSGARLTQAEMEQTALCLNDCSRNSFDQEVIRLGFDTNKHRIWKMSHANENFEFCATYPKLHILPATVDDEKLKECTDFRAGKRFPSVVWRNSSTGVVLIRSSQPLPSFLGLSYFSNEADVFLLDEIVKACIRERDILSKQVVAKKSSTNGRSSNSRSITPSSEEVKAAGRQSGGQGSSSYNSHASASASDGVADDNPNNGGGGGMRRNSSQGSSSSFTESGSGGGGVISEQSSGSSPRLGRGGGGGGMLGLDMSNGASPCDTPAKPMLAIVDCRSRAMIWGNSFKGGGTEDEAKYKCSIIHLDLPNIHSVRDSFNKMRAVCHSYVDGSYYKSLCGSMWLTYISALLRGANIVVELMYVEKRPVLVHCSDGWDRTAQIVSLAQMLMDPYYRTIKGFQVLVQREWLQFGHKFAERGGYDPFSSDLNQQSPVFLQFLDCVHQLTLQYPAEFQFNEAYLVKLLKHSQACLFGTFLHNNEKDRQNCPYKSSSLWSLLKEDNSQFVNLLYSSSNRILTAHYGEHDVVLWKSVYMAGLSPFPHRSLPDFCLDQGEEDEEVRGSNPGQDGGVSRSRSVDDLSKINPDNSRRSSDPNIAQSPDTSGSGSASFSPSINVAAIHDTSSSSAEIIPYPEESSSYDSGGFHSCESQTTATATTAAAVLPVTTIASNDSKTINSTHVETSMTKTMQDMVTSDKKVTVNGSDEDNSHESVNNDAATHNSDNILLNNSSSSSLSSPTACQNDNNEGDEMVGPCSLGSDVVNLEYSDIPVDVGSSHSSSNNTITVIKQLDSSSGVAGSVALVVPPSPSTTHTVSTDINKGTGGEGEAITYAVLSSQQSSSTTSSSSSTLLLSSAEPQNNRATSIPVCPDNGGSTNPNNLVLDNSNSDRHSTLNGINTPSNPKTAVSFSNGDGGVIDSASDSTTKTRATSTADGGRTISLLSERLAEEEGNNKPKVVNGKIASPDSENVCRHQSSSSLPQSSSSTSCSRCHQLSPQTTKTTTDPENKMADVTVMNSDERKLFDLKQIAQQQLKKASKNLTASQSADSMAVMTQNGFSVVSHSATTTASDKQKPIPIVNKKANGYTKVNGHNSTHGDNDDDIGDDNEDGGDEEHRSVQAAVDNTMSTDTLVGDLDDALRESPHRVPCDQMLGINTTTTTERDIGGDYYSSNVSTVMTHNPSSQDRKNTNSTGSGRSGGLRCDSCGGSGIGGNSGNVNLSTPTTNKSTAKNSTSTSTHSIGVVAAGGSLATVKGSGKAASTSSMSRRARTASGASSRELSVSPSSFNSGNWSDTGRLRHASGGESSALMANTRRNIAASVSTSTTDISDSCVGKIPPSTTERQTGSVRQHLDVDSLTLFSDHRQDLLADLVSEKDRKISELENRLSLAIDYIRASRNRQFQQQQQIQACPVADECLQNEPEGGEHSSLGTISNPASDTSWEQLDETEERVVLWVPDDVVTHCAGCDKQFWFYRRKHHCRNCGKIFCFECRNFMAPMPNVYMKEPQRVCRRCHSRLMQLSPGASCDGRIPTLVADG